MKTTNLNWKSKETLKSVVLALSSEPMSLTKLMKELAPLVDREKIGFGQIKSSLDLLEEIIGENNIKLSKFTYFISNPSEVEKKINAYFDSTEKEKDTKKVRVMSDRKILEKTLKDFLKLKKVFDIISPFESKGALTSEIAHKYIAVMNVKSFGNVTVNNLISLINKYQIKGFRRELHGREYRYFFYDKETKVYLESRILKLSKDLGIEVDLKSSLVVDKNIEEKLLSNEVKVTDSFDREVKMEAIKILYLKNIKGITSQELSRELFLRMGGRQFSIPATEVLLKELQDEIDPEIFRSGFDNYKILDYSRAISIYAPNKSKISFSIKVPREVSLKSSLSGVQFDELHEVDNDDKFITYDITAKNSKSLMIGLVRLVLGFGVSIQDSLSESTGSISKYKSIILTKNVKDKVNKYIETILNNSENIVD